MSDSLAFTYVLALYTHKKLSPPIVFPLTVPHLLKPLYISHFLCITDVEMSSDKTLRHRGPQLSEGARQAHGQLQCREQRSGG